jgi:hypothetical protein
MKVGAGSMLSHFGNLENALTVAYPETHWLRQKKSKNYKKSSQRF